MFYSRQKHGAIPCCRDFERERRESEAARAPALEALEMRRELEAVAKVNNPLGGSALVIRNLGAKAAEAERKAAEADRAQAELARFKQQVASSVQAAAAEKGAVLASTAQAPKREGKAKFKPTGTDEI